MRIVTLVASLLLPGVVAAGSLFPAQPAPMSPGYGVPGAGLHSATPQGVPGADCVVNPVSLEVSRTEEVTTKFVAGDVISIPTTVLFDFDGDFVRPEGLEDLANVFELLTGAGVTELSVVGHTDSRGTEAYNDDLGLRRATAVAGVLNDLGFENVTADSVGELEPIRPNTFEDGSDNPDGRQANRRVEIEVISVSDVEVEETVVVTKPRNPQVFHVLSSNNTVRCGANQAQRPFLWINTYAPSYPGVFFPQ